MFLGHYGVAFAAKKYSPSTPLWVFVCAANFLDLLWPIFLLLGWENVKIAPGITRVTPLDFYHYPISHSLMTVLLWSLLFGIIYFIFSRSKRDSLIVGLLVSSHWFLDLLVHRPDLPISFSGSTLLGLGLWNFPVITYLLEFGIFFFGVYSYFIVSPVSKRKKIVLWSLIVFLCIIYLSNIFGPPPPSTQAIAIAGNALWLIVIWSYFIEKNHDRNKER